MNRSNAPSISEHIVNQVPDLLQLWDYPGLGAARLDTVGQVFQANMLFSTWCGDDMGASSKSLHRHIKGLQHSLSSLNKISQTHNLEHVSFNINRIGLKQPLSLRGLLFKNQEANAKANFFLICWLDKSKKAKQGVFPFRALKRLVIGMPIGIISINADWSCEFVNEKFCLLTEKTEKQLLGLGWTSVFAAQNERLQNLVKDLLANSASKSELHLKIVGQGQRILELDFKAYLNNSGQLHYAVGALIDVSERVNRQNDFHRLANYDPVTSLHNRLSIQHQLVRYIGIAQELSQQIQLVFMDLDGFKVINDLYGHQIGDRLLKEVGKRISDSVRSSDIVARFGGDEFLILIPGGVSDARVDEISQKIIDEITQPFSLSEHKVHVTASLGIASYVASESPITMKPEAVMDELIKQADIALYSAKQSGKNRYCRFSSSSSEHITHSYTILQSLSGAINNQEFFMHYQPIVNIQSGQLKAVEALIRWHSPALGLIAPDQFISLAEGHGKIIPVQQCMMEQVCSDIIQLDKTLANPVNVSINLSASQIVNPEHLSTFLHRFNENQIQNARIILEITENMIIEDNQHVQHVFSSLLTSGFNLSLDDFGTGYSSLSYLARMPVKFIKLDKGFISKIESKSSQRALVNGVIQLAHALDKCLIAEGVETHEQLNILKTMGCDYVQGYVNSKPLPIDKLLIWIQRNNDKQE